MDATQTPTFRRVLAGGDAREMLELADELEQLGHDVQRQDMLVAARVLRLRATAMQQRRAA